MRSVLGFSVSVASLGLLIQVSGCGDGGTAPLTSERDPRVWRVPGDVTTIQAAIDSARARDTVLVDPGVYSWTSQASGDSSGMLRIKSGTALRGATGDPGDVVLDAKSHGRVLCCLAADSTTLIQGFTITGGCPQGVDLCDNGGGLLCRGSSSPQVRECVFRDNRAMNGAGVYCDSAAAPTFVATAFIQNTASFLGGGLCSRFASPSLTNCTVIGNAAARYGGGVFCEGARPRFLTTTFVANSSLYGGGLSINNSSPSLESCTLVHNSASWGGGAISCLGLSSPTIVRCIIAYTLDGGAVYASRSATPVIGCTDIFSNVDGDWVGIIAAQEHENDNFSEDPCFCDVVTNDLTLHVSSPCRAGQHPTGADCELVGSHPVGCEDR